MMVEVYNVSPFEMLRILGPSKKKRLNGPWPVNVDSQPVLTGLSSLLHQNTHYSPIYAALPEAKASKK
jgi:hypothetical protein